MKQRWQITKNWQYLFPILGALSIAFTAYSISRRLMHLFAFNNTLWEWPFTLVLGGLLYYLILRICLWCFKKLENRWPVAYKWEMIAIFIVFAVTGSTAAKLAGPLLDLMGLHQNSISGWVYWPIRIILIFPIYQVLLIVFGWLFGQFQFFWNFEKKMLKHLGLGFLFP